MTDINVTEQFVNELQQLLNKYNVEMDVEDDKVAFWAYEKYDENGEIAMALIDFKTPAMWPERSYE